MPVSATIVDIASGQAIGRVAFGRVPRPGATFVLDTGRQVTAQRVEVGKPVPGKFVAPVTVWVATPADARQP